MYCSNNYLLFSVSQLELIYGLNNRYVQIYKKYFIFKQSLKFTQQLFTFDTNIMLSLFFSLLSLNEKDKLFCFFVNHMFVTFVSLMIKEKFLLYLYYALPIS